MLTIRVVIRMTTLDDFQSLSILTVGRLDKAIGAHRSSLSGEGATGRRIITYIDQWGAGRRLCIVKDSFTALISRVPAHEMVQAVAARQPILRTIQRDHS